MLGKNLAECIPNLAMEVVIMAREVHRINIKLKTDGFLGNIRDGRRNVYKVFTRKPLQHCIEKHTQINDFLIY